MAQLEAETEGAGPAVAIFGPDGRLLGSSARFLRLAGVSALPADAGPEALLGRLGFEPVPDVPDHFRREGVRVRRTLERTPDGLCLLSLDERSEVETRARFLSIAAHDLRGPIANVRGYASFLLDSRQDLDPKARRSVEVILRNADRALGLLREYFDSAKATQLPLELDRLPQLLEPIFSKVLEDAAAAAREQGVTLDARMSALPEALVDKEAVGHALSAFVHHGLARTPPGQALEVNIQAADGQLQVTVADRGPALSEEESVHAYDRERRTASEGKLAAGFRLSLARAEVEAHGGAVGLRREGDRTVFFFTLPLG